MCVTCMLVAQGGQKKVLNLLELKSQTVVSDHMGAEN